MLRPHAEEAGSHREIDPTGVEQTSLFGVVPLVCAEVDTGGALDDDVSHEDCGLRFVNRLVPRQLKDVGCTTSCAARARGLSLAAKVELVEREDLPARRQMALAEFLVGFGLDAVKSSPLGGCILLREPQGAWSTRAAHNLIQLHFELVLLPFRFGALLRRRSCGTIICFSGGTIICFSGESREPIVTFRLGRRRHGIVGGAFVKGNALFKARLRHRIRCFGRHRRQTRAQHDVDPLVGLLALRNVHSGRLTRGGQDNELRAHAQPRSTPLRLPAEANWCPLEFVTATHRCDVKAAAPAGASLGAHILGLDVETHARVPSGQGIVVPAVGGQRISQDHKSGHRRIGFPHARHGHYGQRLPVPR